MRLKTIKLAGFKSFVDPTTIPLRSKLTAIVGPNGCGKSNVVDAIRCVIGESSASKLRGEALTDLVFNGTTHRKPVGQAAIELLFDNSDGSLGGEYAKYNEIAIRRELNRDGQSNFYLNNVRCRRRDIMDVFLGTGLGPRSYAIIEQGMISELIEAKPEDIRVYLEEAAGISKYKERRRETENRIGHTRENLARLTDLREEIEKQLAHLKRQANTAERYKNLKQEQRLLKAQLNTLQYQALDTQQTVLQSQIQEQETQVEAKIAEHRHIDAHIEKSRIQHTELNDTFNAVQGRYYKLGADIARQEQQIQHIQERQRQLESDISQLEENGREAEELLANDEAQIQELNAELVNIEPLMQRSLQQAEQSQQSLNQAELRMTDLQSQWDQFINQSAQVSKNAEVEQTRLQQLAQNIQSTELRITRIHEQRQQFNPSELVAEMETFAAQSADSKQELGVLQTMLSETDAEITQCRSIITQTQQQYDTLRDQLQTLQGQKASLEAAQQVALGKTHQRTSQWLEQQNLDKNPRLAEGLRVEPGWETAVEIVLSSFLDAVCMENFDHLVDAMQSFEGGKLTLLHNAKQHSAISVHKESVASKIQSDWPIAGLLQSIYVAENVTQARSMLSDLTLQESVITRDGIWLGANWIRISKQADEKAGILQRHQELEKVKKELSAQQAHSEEQNNLLNQTRQQLTQLEAKRDQLQQNYRVKTSQFSDVHAKLSAKQAQLEQIHQRESAALQELSELQQNLAALTEQQRTGQEDLQKWLDQKALDEAQHVQLQQQKEHCRNELNELRQQAQYHKRTADEYQVKFHSTQNQIHFLNQNISRTEKQLMQLRERRDSLTQTIDEVKMPLEGLQQELTELLNQRLSEENALKVAREEVQRVEQQLREYEKQRNQLEEQTQNLRSQLEQLRMEQRATQVRRDNYLEHIVQSNYVLEQLIQEMPPESDIETWQQRIEQMETRIQRLGPINLAAIEEHTALLERKTYLDNQNNDLTEALNTLEEAIRKIDRESRARLNETFDKANAHFQSYFPKIFGGGHACLELIGDDVLTTGIMIKAQPPGKRNSSIHLLSGGEKALTAISLVFSLFQLNPAPFCILDEVDAPLDDANVHRFCNLVKEMSEKVQFIFISHNKVTMEMAEQLAGITMNEPGVSRLVSVDIGEAIAMAGE